MTGQQYMQRAIELAAKGAGHTNPNPMVGAVIVKDDRIIGEGYHEVYGSLHAERNALKDLKESAEGAELYVILEPCCHHGKQPPCTDAVIESGIKRVYVGSADPNPLVAGKGIRLLKEAGIEVIEGFMKEECDALNPVFFHYISSREPYIALKYAMTADGKTATATARSQWITGEEARRHVHELRNYYSGILAGIGTVLADDPMLNCRIDGGRDPKRIILDTGLRIPLGSKLVKTAKDIPLIVVCKKENAYADAEDGSKKSAEAGKALSAAFAEKKERLKAAGAEVIETELEDGSVSIKETVKELGKRGIDGILVEGGGTVNASFIKAGKVNHVYAYIGAKLFGGPGNFTPVKGEGITEVSEALELADPKVRCFGDDVLIEYETVKRPARMR
ncbi:MAG: bifunctional diaminohydroxyphosphoribosylaminopyrimidine deaminase/5-amino-6-(5-phosphoribosylamino)uracil reductase RibD [Eubacteriales bacterium]|nr:bifunctional diaminohydroxyphosphoribosylaminopyrimidine deaminase/5-amino-6-(5-phosphoribosylamino)uracil reductase RibD [Eubacteriales bacterium]